MTYSQQGLSLLNSPDNALISDPEYKITTAAPLYKWSAAVMGCSAEIVPAVQDKVKNGFKSRDYYKKALELDGEDYYTIYSLGRWHYEVYMLPSLLKRSANWISPEPYNSTVDDCLKELEKIIEIFPYEEPFKEFPSDISYLLGRCYQEKKDLDKAKKYITNAKNIVDRWPTDGLISKKLDVAEKTSITKLYGQIC